MSGVTFQRMNYRRDLGTRLKARFMPTHAALKLWMKTETILRKPVDHIEKTLMVCLYGNHIELNFVTFDTNSAEIYRHEFAYRLTFRSYTSQVVPAVTCAVFRE